MRLESMRQLRTFPAFELFPKKLRVLRVLRGKKVVLCVLCVLCGKGLLGVLIGAESKPDGATRYYPRKTAPTTFVMQLDQRTSAPSPSTCSNEGCWSHERSHCSAGALFRYSASS